MLENEFILKLNEKLEPSERIFYFKSISINEKLGIIEINFLINYQIYNEVLTNELKNKVEKIVKELISNCLIPGDIAEIKVVYSKTNSDTKNIINKIIVYMQENHKNIQPFFLGEDKYKIEHNEYGFRINIKLEKLAYSLASNTDLANELKDYLSGEIIEDINIIFTESDYDSFNDQEIENYQNAIFIKNQSSRFIKFEATSSIKGEVQTNNAKYISDVLQEGTNGSTYTICGRIKKSSCKDVKTKSGKDLSLFEIVVSDNTADIKCKLFVNVKNKENIEKKLVEDNIVAVFGEYSINTKYSSREIMITNISYCKYDFNQINIYKDFNKDLGTYIYLKPQIYNDTYEQSTFLDTFINPVLKENKFVVFDLETTGLDFVKDRIIEIAALKIVDGKFNEYIETFINPEMLIPEKASNINHIYDEDVRLAPKISQIMPDFYRFTKDCILVGHNINNFDIPFLNSQAKQSKYKFDNKTIDTYEYSTKINITKHNKLESLAEFFGIENKDAHRALSDVITNAKVFVKLLNKYPLKNN